MAALLVGSFSFYFCLPKQRKSTLELRYKTRHTVPCVETTFSSGNLQEKKMMPLCRSIGGSIWRAEICKGFRSVREKEKSCDRAGKERSLSFQPIQLRTCLHTNPKEKAFFFSLSLPLSLLLLLCRTCSECRKSEGGFLLLYSWLPFSLLACSSSLLSLLPFRSVRCQPPPFLAPGITV